MSAIRLGRIGYVNMAPVFFRLDADVEEVVGVPTELNRKLIDRQIDVAPISSIEYARNADTLRLLPRLCVSSEGAVESIQLISRAPLASIRSVAITPESGRLWQERTGLPMVFAVWAAPEPTHPDLPELEEALVASLRAARSEPEQLAYESSERYGYPAGFLARYFEKLRYRFGPRERAGLYTFLEMAHDVGELGEVPELRFVSAAGATV